MGGGGGYFNTTGGAVQLVMKFQLKMAATANAGLIDANGDAITGGYALTTQVLNQWK